MSAAVHLEWKDLNLSVEKRSSNYGNILCPRKEKRLILRNGEFIDFCIKRNALFKRLFFWFNSVSGHLNSGQLVAILGASGAGKTSLLASISQRLRGSLTGEILLNGERINRKKMTKMSCFVPQFDITIASFTPNEHLYFMGELKLDRHWSRAQKNQRIQMLLWKLGLQSVANNRISTLSGGERKKLNLATDVSTCDAVKVRIELFVPFVVAHESTNYLLWWTNHGSG